MGIGVKTDVHGLVSPAQGLPDGIHHPLSIPEDNLSASGNYHLRIFPSAAPGTIDRAPPAYHQVEQRGLEGEKEAIPLFGEPLHKEGHEDPVYVGPVIFEKGKIGTQ